MHQTFNFRIKASNRARFSKWTRLIKVQRPLLVISPHNACPLQKLVVRLERNTAVNYYYCGIMMIHHTLGKYYFAE